MRQVRASSPVILAISLGILSGGIGPSALAAQPRETPRTLTVQGIGEATATPDLAIVSLAVETEADEATQAVAENARRTQRVIEAVRGLMGEQARLTTSGYSLQPRYRHPTPRPEPIQPTPEIVGYAARNQIRVELRDLEAVGRVIDAATAAGANRVDRIQFALRERGPTLRSALATAAAEARAQAQSIAASLGVTLGPVLEASTTPGVIAPRDFARAEAMVSLAPTPIEPGEVTVTATLVITYGIE